MSNAIPTELSVNGKNYTVIKLLGKGKGGYSYLASDGTNQYVLKQIHHAMRLHWSLTSTCDPAVFHIILLLHLSYL